MTTDEYANYFVTEATKAARSDAQAPGVLQKSAAASVRFPKLAAVLASTATTLKSVDANVQKKVAEKVAKKLGVPAAKVSEFSLILKAGSLDSFLRIATDIEKLIQQYIKNQGKK